MNATEKNILQVFEGAFDAAIQNLKIKSLPVKIPFLHLCGLLDAACSKVDAAPHGNVGPSLVSRFSYLLKTFSNCPSDDTTNDQVDIGEDHQMMMHEIKLLLDYAHFCEIAPFAWRGFYSIQKDNDSITLLWKTVTIQQAEQKDIIISRLALPITIDIQHPYCAFYDQCVATGQEPSLDVVRQMTYKCAESFVRLALECSPLSDAAMLLALGVSTEQFRRFRAFWHGFASVHIGMSNAIRRHLEKFPEREDQMQINPYDWVAPYLEEDALARSVMEYADLNTDQYGALMDVYAISPPNIDNGGEGFFPPFCRVGTRLLVNPWALRGMMSSRNILYAVLNTDQRKFDEHVSPLLEPQLTEMAVRIFNHLTDVQVVQNYSWGKGEFDLLVYRQSENCILHVQIKAAIAPDGARMTTRVEGRVKEGLKQLQNFRKLDKEQQNSILAAALGHFVEDVQVVDVVLCWAGFGTDNIWPSLSAVAPLNLALLAHLVQENSTRALRTFASDSHALIDRIVTGAKPQWGQVMLQLGSETISFPNMDCDWGSLVKYQLAVHSM
jgi:hypothetical protein